MHNILFPDEEINDEFPSVYDTLKISALLNCETAVGTALDMIYKWSKVAMSYIRCSIEYDTEGTLCVVENFAFIKNVI